MEGLRTGAIWIIVAFLILCFSYVFLRWGSYAVFKSWFQVLRETRDAKRKENEK